MCISALPAAVPAVAQLTTKFVVQGAVDDADSSMLAGALQAVKDQHEADNNPNDCDWRDSLTEQRVMGALAERRAAGHSGSTRSNYRYGVRCGLRVWNTTDFQLQCSIVRPDGGQSQQHPIEAFSDVDEPGAGPFDARYRHSVPWQFGWQIRPGVTLRISRVGHDDSHILFTVGNDPSQHVFLTTAGLAGGGIGGGRVPEGMPP
jgi:hypothetical protein